MLYLPVIWSLLPSIATIRPMDQYACAVRRVTELDFIMITLWKGNVLGLRLCPYQRLWILLRGYIWYG
jgi:hypothetical protein